MAIISQNLISRVSKNCEIRENLAPRKFPGIRYALVGMGCPVRHSCNNIVVVHVNFSSAKFCNCLIITTARILRLLHVFS